MKDEIYYRVLSAALVLEQFSIDQISKFSQQSHADVARVLNDRQSYWHTKVPASAYYSVRVESLPELRLELDELYRRIPSHVREHEPARDVPLAIIAVAESLMSNFNAIGTEQFEGGYEVQEIEEQLSQAIARLRETSPEKLTRLGGVVANLDAMIDAWKLRVAADGKCLEIISEMAKYMFDSHWELYLETVIGGDGMSERSKKSDRGMKSLLDSIARFSTNSSADSIPPPYDRISIAPVWNESEAVPLVIDGEYSPCELVLDSIIESPGVEIKPTFAPHTVKFSQNASVAENARLGNYGAHTSPILRELDTLSRTLRLYNVTDKTIAAKIAKLG